METANKEGVVAEGGAEESSDDDASIITDEYTNAQQDDAPSKSMDGTAYSSPFSTVAVLAVVAAYAVVSRIVHIHRFASLSYTLPSCFLQYYALCRRVQWLAKFGHTGEVSLLWCGLFIAVL